MATTKKALEAVGVGGNGSRKTGIEAPLTITAPKMRVLEIPIVGTAPYVQLRFTEKAKKEMMDKMLGGSQAKKGKKREPRDFDLDFHQSYYLSTKGEYGIPATAFRRAMVDACRLVGFKMTIAKLSVFVVSDMWDTLDATPLVPLDGPPEKVIHPVRNSTGVADLRVRSMWREWSASLFVNFDEDMFSPTDIGNLVTRVGLQVGIGEGRPNSKNSTGMGWGTFDTKKAKS